MIDFRHADNPEPFSEWPRGGLVRKGALARDRMSRDPEVAAACDDLARLADLGLLAGVSEVIRERVRQAEALGYTAEHDDGHHDGWLMHEAARRIASAGRRVAEGTDGPEGVEEGCRHAGALAAAEIDRLIRMLAGQAERGERHPELGIIAPDMQDDRRWAQERETGVSPFPHDAPYPGPGSPCPHGGGVYAPGFRCAACTAEDRQRQP